MSPTCNEPTPPLTRYSTDEVSYRVDANLGASSFALKAHSLLENLSVTITGVGCKSPKAAVRNLTAVQGELLDAGCGFAGEEMLRRMAEAHARRAKCQRVTAEADVTRVKCKRRLENRGLHYMPEDS